MHEVAFHQLLLVTQLHCQHWFLRIKSILKWNNLTSKTLVDPLALLEGECPKLFSVTPMEMCSAFDSNKYVLQIFHGTFIVICQSSDQRAY